MIVDTHAHLDMIKESYIEELIKNAKKANVKTIVTQSVNIKSLTSALEISKRFSEIVKFSAGLYPEETLKESDFDELKEFVLKNKEDVFAIGEIGMDFSHDLPDRALQEKIFRQQLGLAEELNVPVSIHTRKAEKEIVEILKEYPNVKKVLHCFCGKKRVSIEAEKIGCYFSVPTNIVRAHNFQNLVKYISKEKILTETDTPYLSPFKEKDNESAFIAESIKIISESWGMTREETEKQIEQNFNKLYF